jgi:hypothetical protein
MFAESVLIVPNNKPHFSRARLAYRQHPALNDMTSECSVHCTTIQRLYVNPTCHSIDVILVIIFIANIYSA